MKKNNLKVSVVLILSLLILYNVASNAGVDNSSAKTSLSSLSNQPSLKDLVIQSPMTIDYDSDFEGLPGDGSAVNPYRIENYNITTSGDYCLNFGGYTTKHFIIQNCFLKTDTNYAIYLGKYQNMAEETVVILSNVIVCGLNRTVRQKKQEVSFGYGRPNYP